MCLGNSRQDDGRRRLEELRWGRVQFGILSQDGSQSSHWLSPVQVMALCRQLYSVTPRALVVSVAGAGRDHGDTLSEWLRSALASLIDRVKGLIDQLAD
jgi:hypothetical protein